MLVACPIRYWPQLSVPRDNTWIFALNYGAAHGLLFGRDLAWTTGPLGYLVFPQDIGNNLAQALVFQWTVWLTLAAIFFDLFFRAGFRLRNLTAFAIFFGLSAPLYWFNYMGLENLLLAGGLVLLIVERCRGGHVRFALALALLSIVPFIKLTGGIVAFGAVAGFLADKLVRSPRESQREILLALVIPLFVAAIVCGLFIPFASLGHYLKSSLDIAGYYTVAMSVAGDPSELGKAVFCIGLIVAMLYMAAKSDRRRALFLAALLLIPLLVSLKHGFVRQDDHVINFFCMAGLAMGLISLVMSLEGSRIAVVWFVLSPFVIVWLTCVGDELGLDAMQEAIGWRALPMAVRSVRLQSVKAELAEQTRQSFTPDTRIEPEILAIVQNNPVASLSISYSGAILDGLNLQIYPVVQRFSAYTPYLDGRNADWVREQGPRFLIFDWESIDGRHPWAETPAMWLEVYRRYDTRLLGKRNLLLERRSQARFGRLVSISRFETAFSGAIEISKRDGPLFWSLRCPPNFSGTLRKLFLRVPEVRMEVDSKSFRIIPEVLVTPVLGNILPTSLDELATVLGPSGTGGNPVRKISFSGTGLDSYNPSCQVELLVPSI